MLVIYHDVVVSVYGVDIWLIGLADKRLFCTSDDLLETFNFPASPLLHIFRQLYVLLNFMKGN